VIKHNLFLNLIDRSFNNMTTHVKSYTSTHTWLKLV